VIDAPAKPPAPAFVLRGPFMVGRTGNGARVIINAELPAKVPLRELSRERN